MSQSSNVLISYKTASLDFIANWIFQHCPVYAARNKQNFDPNMMRQRRHF
jgi:hypothetical protein